MISVAFLGILFLPFSSLVQAGNEHEHLQYLPSFEDIRFAMKGQLETRLTSELLSKDLEEITSRFGPGVMSEEEFLELRKTRTFLEFCEVLSKKTGKTTESIMREFLEFDGSHADPVKSYGNAGSLRSKLFQNNPKMVEPAILSAIDSSPRHQIRKCVFTIPRSQFDKALLSRLIREFEGRRMQAQFYYSVPRRVLSNPHIQFEKTLEQIKKAHREGWLHGVDISGSLWDSISNYDEAAQNLMRERLVRIFKAGSETGMGVRIHAFENGKQGAFYNALWDSFSECKKTGCMPKTLRIGHISDLDQDSLQKILKSAHKSSLIFEVNAESNYQLVGPRTEVLVTRIEELHRRGLRVAIGSDGVGILGARSRFDVSLSRFKRMGMEESSLKKLIEEAYTPLPGSRYTEAVDLHWQREKQGITKALAGVPVPPDAKSNPCNKGMLNRLRGLLRRF